jgi:hypothetical protein
VQASILWVMVAPFMPHLVGALRPNLIPWKIQVLSRLLVGALRPLQQGMCHTVAFPFTLKKKGILMQKKNYGNSNISPCKKYNLQNIL